MHTLSIDLETYSVVDIRKAGAQRYITDPSFEILLFAYSFDRSDVQIIDLAQGEEIPTWIRTALVNPAVIKRAYNVTFEFNCLSKYFGKMYPGQWRDTMIHGLYCGYAAGLDATGKALGLPEDKQKLTTGKALIRYFCVPCKPTRSNGGRTRNLPHHDPAKWELFKEYCKQDVVTEMEIEQRLSQFPVPEYVEKQWQTDLIINNRGCAVDMDFVDGALEIGAQVTDEMIQEAVQITDLANPNAVGQLKGWLEKETGEEIDSLSKDVVKKLLDEGDNNPDVERMLQIRQELGKTSTKKYNAIRACVCPDDRVRGLLQFYGANKSGRWAGRLLQVQNLPRTYIQETELARELVKGRKKDALRVVYGSVSDTLSQLIRTALVPSPGNVMIDADFSAIEARVISWMAREEWRLNVFRTHGKIYEASASQMFNVPIEKIRKGNPEYALRAKGKVAELALGYQGGPGALINMGALDMGLAEEELPDIVTRWRSSNRHIVDLWYTLQNSVIDTIQSGCMQRIPVGGSGSLLIIRKEYNELQGTYCLTIQLPSGRKLFYVDPAVGTNRFGGASITYKGMDQTTKKWKTIETYGGKLVENCLAGDTLVVTNHGAKRITEISFDDLLWDGTGWVPHDGVIRKGGQHVIDVNGVRMTPDHKILTNGGWVNASQSERYNRNEEWLSDSSYFCRVRREEINLEYSMRLRKDHYDACIRISEGEKQVLWLHERKIDFREDETPRDEQHTDLECVAFNDRTVHHSNSTGLEELWGPWDYSMRGLEALREFLQGYGGELPDWINPGPDRCEWSILQTKLQMGNYERSVKEQEKHPVYRYTDRKDECCGGCREIGDRLYNNTVPGGARLADRFTVHETGYTEPVYDIRNAGPRHRFAVISNDGIMIVHNCVQAVARDCLAEAIERLEAAGFPIVFHVHDEVVIDIAPYADNEVMLQQVIDIMKQPPAWASDMPLNADGWVGGFFTKD